MELNNPLDNIEDSKIEDVLLDRPIRTLYDIAYTYGKLSLLADSERAELVNSDYIKYMTPSNNKIEPYFNDDDGGIYIVVEWDGDSFKFRELSIEDLTWEKTVRSGYCRPYNKSGRMIAHSICQLSGGSGYDSEKVTKYLIDRFTRWPTDDVVVESTEGHENSWIVDKLASFGERFDNNNELKSKIINELDTYFEGSKSITGLFGVKLIIDDTVYYPGELDVLNEGMKAKKLNRIPSYSQAEDAVGTGTCYVTGHNGDVYGPLPGSPANFYTAQQHGSFSHLDVDSSWAQKPLSSDAVTTIGKGSNILNEFVHSVTKNERLVYYPFYAEMNVEKARDMFRLYLKIKNQDNNPIQIISNWLEKKSSVGSMFGDLKNEKRLYALLYYHDQNSLYKVMNEAVNVEELILHKINNEHKELLKPWVFNNEEFGLIKHSDKSKTPLFDSEKPLHSHILTGEFFRQVFEYKEDVGTDDVVFNSTLDLLNGEPLYLTNLYTEYTNKIINVQNWMLSNKNRPPIPNQKIWEQYVHLQLLQKQGIVLDKYNKSKGLINSSSSSTNVSIENRKDRLHQFIDEHKALESPEHVGSFALGALVGRLSQYQRHKLDVSQTLAAQYSVDSISQMRFARIASQVIDKNRQYSEMNNNVMNSRYLDILTDTLQKEFINNWDCTTDELRFYYSLGLAYGYSDTSIEDYNENKN